MRAFRATIVAAVAFATYFDHGNREMVDDRAAIVSNDDVSGARSPIEAFRHDFWGERMDSNKSHKSYRPITVLSFRANRAQVRHGRVGLPRNRVIMHAAVSTPVCALAHMLLGKQGRLRRYSCRPCFACIPSTESAGGLVGRVDIPCALFFVVAFASYARGWILPSFSLPSSPCCAKSLHYRPWMLLRVGVHQRRRSNVVVARGQRRSSLPQLLSSKLEWRSTATRTCTTLEP